MPNAADGNTVGPSRVAGEAVDPLLGWCLTYLINFTGHPAASVPSRTIPLGSSGGPANRRSAQRRCHRVCRRCGARAGQALACALSSGGCRTEGGLCPWFDAPRPVAGRTSVTHGRPHGFPSYAGVIEGFFGRSWDWSARAAYADFLAAHGYRFYIYAPKSDAFLRRRWREPLPAELLESLQSLSRRYRQCGVSLGLGLTPYDIYRNYDAEARAALRAKVLQLNNIGADILCVLFDDHARRCGAPVGDSGGGGERRMRVERGRRFIVCPTYYSYDARIAREFGPPPQSYLRDLGRLLDPGIDFFWTGEKVISTGYSAPHLTDVAADMRRKPFIWDNSISNDAKMRTARLFLNPSAGSWQLPADLIAGIAFNPMNQAHLSQIPLHGFQSLLRTRSVGPAELAAACDALCGSELSRQISRDADRFQNAGLNEFDAHPRRRCSSATECTAAVPTPPRSWPGCRMSMCSTRCV